jgi:hypothetical protein
MTVGFQSFNTIGAYLIDGAFRQFAFKRKVEVPCTLLIDNSSAVGYRIGDFAIDNTEIAALQCNTPCAIVRRMNGTARLATLNVYPSATVTVFIFGPVLANPINYGLQVFNENGVLVYDAAQKCLSMVGFPQGEGSFTYNSSKRYAAICMTQWIHVTSEGHDYGETNRITMTMGMIKEIGGGINIANHLFSDWSQAMDPNQSAFDNTILPYAPNNHIIIDVTNY